MEVQVTLSRAHKVAERLKGLMNEQGQIAQQSLQDTNVSGVTGATQITALTDKSLKGFEALSTYARYNEVFANLRMAIGKANVANGVSDLLAKQEALSRSVGLLQNVLGRVDFNAIQPSQLVDYKPVVVNERSMREPTVSVAMLTAEQRKHVEEQLAAGKKAIFVISDKVADANATKIKFDLEPDLAGLLGLV